MEYLWYIVGAVVVLFLIWKFFKGLIKLALVVFVGFLVYYFFIK